MGGLGWSESGRSVCNSSSIRPVSLVLQEARDSVWSSAVLAASPRDLPFQWEEVFAYRPLLAETFTDPETHAGTCYKAAGWAAVGMSSGQGKHCADLYPGRARPKKLWLKALEPKARETLCAAELPAAQQAGLAAHAGVRCALKTPQLRSLYDVFSKARDPRRRQARRYPIGAGLTLTALGLLCGAVHLSTIVRTAQKLTRAQRRQLRLPRKKATRFYRGPCYDVFGDVLHRIDLQILAQRLTGWLQSQAGERPAHLGHRWKNHSRPPGPDRRLGRHRRGHSCGLGGQREGQRPRTQNDPTKAAGENLTRYFISSWDPSQKNPQSMARLIQSHWSCESRHWQRDACWRGRINACCETPTRPVPWLACAPASKASSTGRALHPCPASLKMSPMTFLSDWPGSNNVTCINET